MQPAGLSFNEVQHLQRRYLTAAGFFIFARMHWILNTPHHNWCSPRNQLWQKVNNRGSPPVFLSIKLQKQFLLINKHSLWFGGEKGFCLWKHFCASEQHLWSVLSLRPELSAHVWKRLQTFTWLSGAAKWSPVDWVCVGKASEREPSWCWKQSQSVPVRVMKIQKFKIKFTTQR